MLDEAAATNALLANRVSEGFVHAILWPVLAFLFLSTIGFSRFYSGHVSLEKFLTYRGTTSWVRVGVSHFATTLGGWAIFLVPMYGSRFGWLSLFINPVVFGLVFLFIGYAAPRMAAQMEKANLGSTFYSLTDYVSFRYGSSISFIIGANTIFCSVILMVTELANAGNLVRLAVNGGLPGSPADQEGYAYFSLYPILAIALVTATYTVVAGFPASIWSDLVQGIGVLLLTLILVIAALIVNVRQADLAKSAGVEMYQVLYFLNDLFCVTPSAVLNLGIWQRVLITTDKRQQRKAILLGVSLVTPAFIMLGLVGYTFGAKYNLPQSAHFSFHGLYSLPLSVLIDLPQWLFGLLLVIVIGLASSSVDSAQAGILSVFAGRLLDNSTGQEKCKQLTKEEAQKTRKSGCLTRFTIQSPWILAGVITFSVTAVAAGLAGYLAIDNTGPFSTAIVGIYGISNLLQMATSLPLFMGLSPRITRRGALFGMVSGMAFPFLWGLYHDGSLWSGFSAYLLRTIHTDPVQTRVNTCFFDHQENICAFKRVHPSLVQEYGSSAWLALVPVSCEDPNYPRFLRDHQEVFSTANVSTCHPSEDMRGHPVSWFTPDVTTHVWNLQLYLGILMTSFGVTYLISLLSPPREGSLYFK